MAATRSKREAVLDAAIELLLANGYEGTSMDAVAARAGVSKTTVYAHFSDKLALFLSVMRYGGEQLASRLDAAQQRLDLEHASAEDRVVATVIEATRAGVGTQIISYFRLIIAELDRRQELQAAFEGSTEGTRPDIIQIIGDLLVGYAAERDFTVEEPRRWAIIMMKMTASGVQLDMLISGFTPSDQLLEQHVEIIVRTFLRGLRPDPDGVLRLPAGYDYPWGPGLYR